MLEEVQCGGCKNIFTYSMQSNCPNCGMGSQAFGKPSEFAKSKIDLLNGAQDLPENTKQISYKSGSFKEMAIIAARESGKNALLFRNYGIAIQIFGGIFALILVIVYFYLYEGIFRLLGIFIGFSFFIPIWFIGAFVRGIASYIRFKSLAYLAETTKNK